MSKWSEINAFLQRQKKPPPFLNGQADQGEKIEMRRAREENGNSRIERILEDMHMLGLEKEQKKKFTRRRRRFDLRC
jgi:hypothetical protein